MQFASIRLQLETVDGRIPTPLISASPGMLLLTPGSSKIWPLLIARMSRMSRLLSSDSIPTISRIQHGLAIAPIQGIQGFLCLSMPQLLPSNAVQITGQLQIRGVIAASQTELLTISTLPLRLAMPIQNSQNASAPPRLVWMVPKFVLAFQRGWTTLFSQPWQSMPRLAGVPLTSSKISSLYLATAASLTLSTYIKDRFVQLIEMHPAAFAVEQPTVLFQIAIATPASSSTH